ncbi:unnamed protein product [Symbiodinium microadriaticum]|nr:unnamed protein product [Symbiodinium microadriaticum]
MPATLNEKVLTAFLKNGQSLCADYQLGRCRLEVSYDKRALLAQAAKEPGDRSTCASSVRSSFSLGSPEAGSLLLIIFSILHLLQRHCVPGRSLERCVQIRSDEEREQLVSTLDSELRLTCDMEMTSQTGVLLQLPAGAQLVDDVGGIKPGMLGYLSSAPVGSVVAFRLQPLTRWNVFLETHCGGSPDQIIQGSLIWLVCGAVICLALFFTRHYLEGLCGLVLLALLTAPAVCLMVLPQRARFCHAFISLFLAFMAFVLTACASRRPALLLWSAAALGVGSHWLLPRKLHHMGRVSLLFTLVFAAVCSCLISISFGALVKGELEPPHFAQDTFQFPSKGHMTDWGVENFTAAPCTIFYGTTDWQSPLALVDFALFNNLVYMPDEPLRRHLQEWLPGWELGELYAAFSVSGQDEKPTAILSAMQIVGYKAGFREEGFEPYAMPALKTLVSGQKHGPLVILSEKITEQGLKARPAGVMYACIPVIRGKSWEVPTLINEMKNSKADAAKNILWPTMCPGDAVYIPPQYLVPGQCLAPTRGCGLFTCASGSMYSFRK